MPCPERRADRNSRGGLECATLNPGTSGGLRARLKAEADARTREAMEDAVRRIGAESEVRIREAVAQATADLADQAERMSRAAGRIVWLRLATVDLAMAAGGIGGAVVLLILCRVS